jgi:hypothetical protein
MRLLSWCSCVLAIALMVGHANASVIYDYATDFSLDANPNGVWSYGAKVKDGEGKPTGEFVLFDVKNLSWVGPQWYMSNDNITHFGGETWLNQTDSNQYNIDPGHCSLNGDFYCTSTARWTAPFTGLIDLSVYMGPSGSARLVMLNDTVLAEGSCQYLGLAVTAGDVIDVTAYGANQGGGNTQTDITITVVPEPSSLLLLAIGVGLWLWRRR